MVSMFQYEVLPELRGLGYVGLLNIIPFFPFVILFLSLLKSKKLLSILYLLCRDIILAYDNSDIIIMKSSFLSPKYYKV
jgi:hypothetical protein